MQAKNYIPVVGDGGTSIENVICVFIYIKCFVMLKSIHISSKFQTAIKITADKDYFAILLAENTYKQ